MEIALSEYIYMVILRCVVQKLCVAENCLPPGLSIANLRYKKNQKSEFILKYKYFIFLCRAQICRILY